MNANLLTILAAWYESTFVILLFIIAFFAIIALAVFLIRKFVINKNKDGEEKPIEKTQAELAEENLDSVLEVIDDEETLKQFDDLSNEDKTK